MFTGYVDDDTLDVAILFNKTIIDYEYDLAYNQFKRKKLNYSRIMFMDLIVGDNFRDIKLRIHLILSNILVYYQ